MLELRLTEHSSRDYNITTGRLEARGGSVPVPITIAAADYCEGNGPEWAAVGNVAITTAGERLFLREPLGLQPLAAVSSSAESQFSASSGTLRPLSLALGSTYIHAQEVNRRR